MGLYRKMNKAINKLGIKIVTVIIAFAIVISVPLFALNMLYAGARYTVNRVGHLVTSEEIVMEYHDVTSFEKALFHYEPVSGATVELVVKDAKEGVIFAGESIRFNIENEAYKERTFNTGETVKVKVKHALVLLGLVGDVYVDVIEVM